MSTFQLCLLDCQSIQQYVFGSNKLKTNIGASENVSAIFKKVLEDSLKEPYDIASWKDDPSDIKILKHDSDLVAEAGYIGGGNALLIFRKNENENPAKEFVKQWSRQLLIDYPGIVPAAVFKDLEKVENAQIPKSELDSLFRALTIEKNRGVPLTILPRHGITAECKQTGLSAEIYHTEQKRPSQWLSSVSKAKLTAGSAKTAQYDKLAYNEEQLGQTEAQNHIAVVHIDGNSMGNQFMQCDDLEQRRKLSMAVNNATYSAWVKLKSEFERGYGELIKKDIIKEQKDDNGRIIWPFRELVLNGDDLTFVCNAQLAFWLAEVFLTELSKSELKNGNNKFRMSACAGIAIVKTKFPFYRAYQLAEELCASAKTEGRQNAESWIDFEVVYGGLSGDLEQIRKKKYYVNNDGLILRPWRVLDEKGDALKGDRNWESMKEALKLFNQTDKNGRDKWPRSKRKELLQRMSRGIDSFTEYEKILAARDLSLKPQGTNDLQRLRFYYDTLQISEFYPNVLIDEEVDHE